MRLIINRICLVAFCIGLQLTVSNHSNADAVSLANLFNGDVLVDGSTTFSNFQLIDDFGTTSLDLNQVMVDTSTDGTSGLIFQSNGQFELDAGIESIIFQFSFDANTTGQSWTSTSVELGDSNVGGLGLIDVFNTISDPTAMELTNTNAMLDPGFGVEIFSDSQLLNVQQSSVNFVSSLTLFADDTSATSLDSFQLSLSVPEPGSAIVLLSLAVVGTLRRSR